MKRDYDVSVIAGEYVSLLPIRVVPAAMLLRLAQPRFALTLTIIACLVPFLIAERL